MRTDAHDLNGEHAASTSAVSTTNDPVLSHAEGGETKGLTQRFSWERPDDKPLPVPVPETTTAVPRITEPEHLPEILPEMPYERPRSRGLHIVNPNEVESPISPVQQEGLKDKALPSIAPARSQTVSPLSESQSSLTPQASKLRQGNDMIEIAPSPISERRASDADSFDTRLPSYYYTGGDVLGYGAAGAAAATGAAAVVASHSKKEAGEEEEEVLPTPTSPLGKDPSSPRPPGSRPVSGSQRIPTFKEILTIKSPTQRIDSYNSTRQTFATMDTGLGDWMNGMISKHPEHAGLVSVPPGGYKYQGPLTINAAPTFRLGHRKASPSLARLTSLTAGPGASNDRKVSSGDPGGESLSPSGGGELQQRGKDLIKNAGVLGGKAQAGAKGLFAKGKSRFGRKDGGDAKV